MRVTAFWEKLVSQGELHTGRSVTCVIHDAAVQDHLSTHHTRFTMMRSTEMSLTCQGPNMSMTSHLNESESLMLGGCWDREIHHHLAVSQ